MLKTLKIVSQAYSIATGSERIYNPITAIGFSAMFTFQLRDKHCQHPIGVMGVVDTFGHRRLHCNYNILPVVQEQNSVIQKNNIVSFSFIIIVCFKIISQCLCRSMILFRKSGINCCQIASFRTQLFTHQSMLDFLHRFPIRYRQPIRLGLFWSIGWFSVGICKYKPGYKSHDLL